MSTARCPVCSETALVAYPQNLYQCPGCFHIFEYPALVTAKYNQEYVDKRYETYKTTDTMSYLRVGFLKYLTKAGRLLDVGYGNGAFVRAASAAGFDAYGNDVHKADYGIREAELNDGTDWDVVTFFDSLEHFPDLEVIRDLSRRSHYVIVSLPNRPARFPQSLSWKHHRPGEHLHYFCLTSLSRLFNDKKLVVVSDLEDTIRGSDSEGQNILTTVFVRKTL